MARVYLLCLALLLATPRSGIAQTLTGTLGQLQSKSLMQRTEAVDRLAANSDWLATPDTQRALLELVDRENRGALNRGLKEFGEGYGGYYSRILGLVAPKVDSSDQRALSILVQSWYSPDSKFGVTLASYGETVVAPLLALTRREDPGNDIVQRSNAYQMLGFVLKAHRHGTSVHPLSFQSSRIVEQRLHEGLRDSHSTIRLLSIYGVVAAGDLDTLPILEQMASTDPKAIRMESGRTRYLVREEAARAIATLKSNVESR